MEMSEKVKTLLITHPRQPTISFCFLIQCSQRFIFPLFKFDQFFDPIDVTGVEISWILLHEVYDKDEKYQPI